MADAGKGSYRLPMIWAVGGCVLRGFPSEEVATRDLSIAVDSRDEGRGMWLELSLLGPEGHVLVRGGDVLSVRSADGELGLEQDGDIYEAPLGDFEGELEISLQRVEDHDVSFLAPVAPAYDLVAQPTDESLQLTWEPQPGAHSLVLGVQGECQPAFSRPLAVDTGYYSLSRAELSLEACTLEISLGADLWTGGSLVPGQEGGDYSVSSSRSSVVEVEWGP
jgi:hypothetical protein